ncbi:hypothetical protein P153DRAFT_278789 [Dothidotthia symphoricarpi CBS 119687]|uniref:Uncharacterized protein n=1 Tax=Dothidotthia symphoricarpi CBS 119687 TaxID=1392245 RepID=A0A6A6AWX0_9PLEO|nr:uncharacterized protein P153DRAFT_278789 [Dothidotthia symphoricarpi CBS 119687]KAF2135031.1 hypothetical protein P153DRAFT_278789 [Dothidotthia symphoricarpi CBS 119687]
MSANEESWKDTFNLEGLYNSLPRKRTTDGNSPQLLKLPDEILCHIANYLAPVEAIGKYNGYGLINDHCNRPSDTGTTRTVLHMRASEARRSYATGVQTLLSLALTCKRLRSVAYDVLYRRPALPQPVDMRNGHLVSALPRFLQTIVERPELGGLVRHLAVWLWIAYPVRQVHGADERACVCGGCTQKVRSIVDALRLPEHEKSKWLETLACPTEAMVCSLVLASLPNLQTLELYVRPLPSCWNHEVCVGSICGIEKRGSDRPPVMTDTSEVTVLSRGLALTRIHTLILSTDLNGLNRAGLPSLTTLTLDFSKRNPFVMVAKGSFANVATLKIQGSAMDPTGHDQPFVDHQLKLELLFSKLPQLRTLEFETGLPAGTCTIPSWIEKIIIRDADWNTLLWAQYIEETRVASSALRHIEVYWRGDYGVPPALVSIEGSAIQARVTEVFMWKGSCWEVLEILERV